MITIVLARPEIPANVGFVARNMACHGLTDLRIVGRPGIASQPEALRTSSGQEAILQSARDFESMEPALADCAFALAFSRRARDPGQRVLDLPEAIPQFSGFASPDPASGSSGASGRLALVFGCESQGLSREETFHCSHVVRIPLPGPMLSLNLSHAVAIALYAFHGGAPGNAHLGKEQTEAIREKAARSIPGKAESDKSFPPGREWAAQSSPSGNLDVAQGRLSAFRGPVPAASPTSEGGAPASDGSAPASDRPGGDILPLAETEAILNAVIARLQERGQLKPAKAEAHVEYLRILWQRLQPTRREVEFLAGLLKKLST